MADAPAVPDDVPPVVALPEPSNWARRLFAWAAFFGPVLAALWLGLRAPPDGVVAQRVADGLLLLGLVIGPSYMAASVIDPRTRARIQARLTGGAST